MLRISLLALALTISGVASAQLSPQADSGASARISLSRPEGNGLGTLMRTDVQCELHLTELQWQRISLLIQRSGTEGRDGASGTNGAGGQGGAAGADGQGGSGGPGRLQAERGGSGGVNASYGFDENDSVTHDLRVILTPAQYARYVELDLQLTGVEAISRPDVARKLALTREQRATVRQIELGMFTTTAQSNGADLDQLIQMAKKQHEEIEKKLLAVLTDQQRAGWNSMLGKPFTFENATGQ